MTAGAPVLNPLVVDARARIAQALTEIQAVDSELAAGLFRSLDPSEDAIELNDRNGWVTIRDDGAVWQVKPPKLGVLRQLDLMAAQLTREASAAAEVAVATADSAEAAPEAVETLTASALSRQVSDTLPWWRLLFEHCADHPLPADDECPIWMGGVVLVSVLLTHWMTFPLRGRGIGPLVQSVTGVMGQT